MPFTLLTPKTPEEAVRLLREPGTSPPVSLAGGTDLLFDLASGRAPARLVVSLRHLPWRTLAWEGERLTVGSTAPLADVARDPGVRSRHPGLAQAIRAVGGPALRSRATFGGNLGRAAPASDLIPILLALDARVRTFGPSGERDLSVAELIRGPRTTQLERGELIASVRLPEPRPSAYLWQRVRAANDISQVGVAAAFSPAAQRWGIAVGGAWPSPTRLADVEALLEGPRPGPDALARAGALAARQAPFQSDRRASEEYRRQVLGVLVGRAVRHASAEGPP